MKQEKSLQAIICLHDELTSGEAWPSFAGVIACLGHELWHEGIKCVFGNSAAHDKKCEVLLEALAPTA